MQSSSSIARNIKIAIALLCAAGAYYLFKPALIELNYGPPEFRVRVVNSRPVWRRSTALPRYAVMTRYEWFRRQTGLWPPPIDGSYPLMLAEGGAIYVCDAAHDVPTIARVTSMGKPDFFKTFELFVHDWIAEDVTASFSGCVYAEQCPQGVSQKTYRIALNGHYQEIQKTKALDADHSWKPGDPPYSNKNVSLPKACETLILDDARAHKDALIASQPWF